MKKIDLEHFPTNDAAKRMLQRVSKMRGVSFYEKSYVGKWLYEVMGAEMEEARNLYGELREQAFPETATWGLVYWEQRYGLPINTGQPIPLRRRAVLAQRSIRSPMNPARVEEIISAMTGLPVNVTENIAPYRFLVAILGGGAGVDYGAVTRQLRRMKPSHQDFEYEATEELSFDLYDGMVLLHKCREVFVDDEDMPGEISIPNYSAMTLLEPRKEIFVDDEGMPGEIIMPSYAAIAMSEPRREIFIDDEGMPNEIILPNISGTGLYTKVSETFIDDEGMAETITMQDQAAAAIWEPIAETFVDTETLPQQFNETSHTFTTPWEARTEVFE